MDDWAWVWHYYGSGGLSEFILPFKSLRHEFDGYLLALNFKLLDQVPLIATQIWCILKAVIFVLNAILLYFIAKSVLCKKSLLPAAVTVTYLTSPIALNLCLVELPRRIYLSFFLVSVLCSVKSISKTKFKLSYYLSALFFVFLSMLGLESFILFDAARPIIIFYMLSKAPNFDYLKTLKRSILYWFPFVLTGVFILTLRMGLLVPRSGVYASSYAIKSLSAFQYPGFLMFGYLKSLVFLLLSYVWSFSKGMVVITAEPSLVLQSIIVTVLAMVMIFRKRILSGNNYRNSALFFEAKITTIVGIFLILVGLFPYIMTRGGYRPGIESRHGMLASIGISVFIPALLLMLYYKGRIKAFFLYFLFGSLIFLGVFQCNIAVKFYGKDWEQQRSFWWKFMRQVPEIRDKTYLLVDMPREAGHYLGNWRGSYEFACPLNLLYARSRDKDEINRHYAESMEYAFGNGATEECSYWANADKKEVQFESFKGLQIYYPKNLIIVSYHQGFLSLNGEICEAGRNCTKDIKLLLPHIAAGQILYKMRTAEFPFRFIIGCEPGQFRQVIVLKKGKHYDGK